MPSNEIRANKSRPSHISPKWIRNPDTANVSVETKTKRRNSTWQVIAERSTKHTYFRIEHVLMFKIVMEKRGAATEYFNYAERNDVRCNIRGRLFFINPTNKLSRDISVLKNRNYYLQRDYFFVSFFLFSFFSFFLFCFYEWEAWNGDYRWDI